MSGKKTILVTYAVKEEFFPVKADGFDIQYLYTGVGKTKSACKLTKVICAGKPDFVLNVGTAGTQKHKVGDIFVSTAFIDRDYEAMNLPGLAWEINGMELLQKELPLRDWVKQYPKTGICSTGDSFITEATAITGDVIDMEAYAQAFVCREFMIPFLSVKYITDIIGQNSVEQWKDKLPDACSDLTNWFEQYGVISLINV
ncbi:MAG: nucleosidase [Candidatus Saccharibacteria bacterium]